MPAHSSHRRDRRARAPKARRRRNLTKFVPSADTDFALTARDFARHVQEHRDELGICERDAEHLVRLVDRFRDSLAKTSNPATRTSQTIRDKDDARKEAERWVRMIGRKIRTDHEVGDAHKIALRLKGLPSRKTEKGCPQRPPVLQFVGTGDGVDGSLGAGNGSGVHVLKFFDEQTDIRKPDFGVVRKARPDGAAGVELWVGFIPEGMRVPTSPQEYQQKGYGWPLYLRKFVSSPVEASFPMPDRPMLIVYWARWVNAAGDQGRFCKTCIARVEGWPKGIGQLPGEAPISEMHVEDRAKHALPLPKRRATTPTLMELERMQAQFLLVGTPLALPAGEDVAVGDASAEARMIKVMREAV